MGYPVLFFCMDFIGNKKIWIELLHTGQINIRGGDING